MSVWSRTKKAFERTFPERQIYHRSGGSVRYVSISPWRQAAIAGLASIIVLWCLFATVSVLLRGTTGNLVSGGSDRKVARYERELKQARAGEAIALSLLEKRTQEFEQHLSEAESRHDTLKRLVAYLEGNSDSFSEALDGTNAEVLVDSTIEEADARTSHPNRTETASADSVGYRSKFDTLRTEQEDLLAFAEDAAVTRAERARGVLRLTGVPVSQVANTGEMGGPLVELSGLNALAVNPENASFTGRVMEVAARLQEARQYEDLIHALPLGAPVGVPYRETSGYGVRTDPFTRRYAYHEGVDIGAFYGAPITATAPGKVVFAGVKSGYGRCVEVDHGLGFRTRYGHLASIAVRAGTTVAIGQKVGTMGSTGRSTGPHLHYEVHFRGKTYDPIRFLRAGKHVH
ncbi:MAG: peptidoglycan DD-metalloendopeptidase family protein [Hyphomonadaceae bacterium]